jgi:glycerol-3-phosphate acyltransferase PlsX
MKIILDGLGGDNAPDAEIIGASEAVREGVNLIIVGPEKILKRRLKKEMLKKIEIYDCEERVEMEESPSEAIRKKRNSTIGVGIRLLKEGYGDAFVSAGNTGAVMAFSLFNLGTAEGVIRPAIGGIIPRKKGASILIDMGANVDSNAIQLCQFAIMGGVYYRIAFGKNAPSIGLLSTGKERGKGNRVVKEADKILEKAPINYIGLVEGRDVFTGTADVVVCDGFVGNTLLKSGEALVEFILDTVKEEVKRNPRAIFGYLLMRKALIKVKKKLDYSEYGGAPLLGVKKPVFICHGSSPPAAIKNALKLAEKISKDGLIEKVVSAIEESIKWLPT